MSTWNFRVLDVSDENLGEPYLELVEVHYDDKGIPVGWTSPCTGSEDIAGMYQLVEWYKLALAKPVLNKADFVGSFNDDEDDARAEDEAQFASYANPPVRSDS